MSQFYANVPVMDEGARGAATTFVQHGIGDVLVGWENEALMIVNGFGRGRFDIVYPPRSILTEPPVAVVDKYADAHGTRAVAEAYLKFLYTPEGQEIAAKHYFRPRLAEVGSNNTMEFSRGGDCLQLRRCLGVGGRRRKFTLMKEGCLTKSTEAAVKKR